MSSEDQEIFGQYRILRRDDGSLWELGRGGQGVTFRARHESLSLVVSNVGRHLLTAVCRTVERPPRRRRIQTLGRDASLTDPQGFWQRPTCARCAPPEKLRTRRRRVPTKRDERLRRGRPCTLNDSENRFKDVLSFGDDAYKRKTTITGRSRFTDSDLTVEVDGKEIRDVIYAPVDMLLQTIADILAGMPVELMTKLRRSGIFLIGGLSAMKHFGVYLSEQTGLPVFGPMNGEPLTEATADGLQKMLCNPLVYRRLEHNDHPVYREYRFSEFGRPEYETPTREALRGY